MSAKLFVPAGAPLHASAGEMSLPWQVYSFGIGPSCTKADEVIASAMTSSSMTLKGDASN